MIFKNYINLALFLILFAFFSCEKEDEINTLQVSKEEIEIPAEGGRTTFTIETNAESWAVENPASDWVNIPILSGTNKEALISVTVDSKTLTPRADTLIVTAGNANPVLVIVSQSSSAYLYDLKTNKTYTEFGFGSGYTTLNITSDAPDWSLTCDADWIQLSQNNGDEGTFNITINVASNTETTVRSATIILNGEGAPTSEITITQKGTYPSYNTSPLTPDATGMNSTAAGLAAKIKLGWNIGNSLEASGGETNWGNPLITKALIDSVKKNGFNAVRLPCSWNQYMENSSTAKIKSSWLDRVKTVVQYCINDDMYVILNIHWDGGWLENNCSVAKQEENNAKQKAFWEQIATHLRDFDEHLMFASANEPNVDNGTQMSVLTSYHQTFIDAVRSTGGKNSYRVLVIQGPSTDITKTNQLMNTLPVDETPDRLMVEVHYYTPWNFCGMTADADWGNMFYYWGEGYHSATDPTHNATCCEEAAVNSSFSSMKTKFVLKGIPVVLGEFSVVRRSNLTGDALTLHLASRAYFLKYITQQARANGILPFYWDNGGTGVNGAAIFNRKNNTVFDRQALDALVQGATQ